MAKRKPAKKHTQKSARSSTRQVTKKAVARPGPLADKADAESAVLANIDAMPGTVSRHRRDAPRDHQSQRASPHAESLVRDAAYARDGKVVCFFRGAKSERYMTLGFTEEAKLDEGHVWPTAFALKKLTTAEEATIGALVKKAVS